MLEDKALLDTCRLFGCLPSDLDDEDYHLIQRLREINAAEKQYQKMDADMVARRPPPPKRSR